MSRPLLDPEFWKERLDEAVKRGEMHRSVYVCSHEDWLAIERVHRGIIARTIGKSDSVLDAGCAYGRMVDMMPEGWCGDYLGVDLSPDFIEIARESYPNRAFFVGDLRDLPSDDLEFDWAIVISVKHMISELGAIVWDQIEQELRRVARKVLILEYSRQEEFMVLT